MLKYYREKKRISQSQLAKAVGVPTPTISKYESGEKDFNKIGLVTGLKIANALGVKITDIIDKDLITVGEVKPKRNKIEALRFFLEHSGYGSGYKIYNSFATGIGYGVLTGNGSRCSHSSHGFEWEFTSNECQPFIANDKLINETLEDQYRNIIKEIGIERIRKYNEEHSPV